MGKSKFLSLAVAFVVLCLLASAQAELTLYATGKGTSDSALYIVDPTSGIATLKWELPGVRVEEGGLAYDPETDTLFATGGTSNQQKLYTIDRSNGHTKEIGVIAYPNGQFSSGGLAIDPNAPYKMYAVATITGQQEGGFFSINKKYGIATLIGKVGSPMTGTQLYGLGFGNGVLYGNGNTFSKTDSTLFTVDVSTGNVTEKGPHGVTVGGQLLSCDLAFGENGTMYCIGSITMSSNGLYSVNLSSGQASQIGNGTGRQFGVNGGLAFAPAPRPQHLIPNWFLMTMLVLVTLIVVFGLGRFFLSRRP